MTNPTTSQSVLIKLGRILDAGFGCLLAFVVASVAIKAKERKLAEAAMATDDIPKGFVEWNEPQVTNNVVNLSKDETVNAFNALGRELLNRRTNALSTTAGWPTNNMREVPPWYACNPHQFSEPDSRPTNYCKVCKTAFLKTGLGRYTVLKPEPSSTNKVNQPFSPAGQARWDEIMAIAQAGLELATDQAADSFATEIVKIHKYGVPYTDLIGKVIARLSAAYEWPGSTNQFNVGGPTNQLIMGRTNDIKGLLVSTSKPQQIPVPPGLILDGQTLKADIPALVKSGEVCKVIGHRWKGGPVMLSFHPIAFPDDYVPPEVRHCEVCKVEQTKSGDWQ